MYIYIETCFTFSFVTTIETIKITKKIQIEPSYVVVNGELLKKMEVINTAAATMAQCTHLGRFLCDRRH